MKRIAKHLSISLILALVIIGGTLQGASLVDSDWNTVMVDFQSWKSFVLS